MAGQKTEEKAEKAAEGEKVMVGASTSDKELTKMLKEGKKLEFTFEDFRELDGRVLDEMDHDSLQTYFRERALFRKKERRERDEAEYGRADGVIEVIGAGAAERMRVEGLTADLHPCWKSPDEVAEAKRAGYITVDGRFPGVRAGDKTSSGTHEVKRKDGTTEAILMAIPTDRYDAHQNGVSGASRKRAAGQMAKFDQKAKGVQRNVKTNTSVTTEKVKVHG